VAVVAVATPLGIAGYSTANLPRSQVTRHRCSVRIRLRTECGCAARGVRGDDVRLWALLLKVTAVRKVILIVDTLLRHDDVIVDAGGLVDIKAAVSAHTKTSRHLQVVDI